MAIGSGLSGSFGYSKQGSAYTTRTAPAKFIRHRSCDFQPVYNRVQGEGIQSGALGFRSDQLVQTHQAGTASVEFDVVTLNMVQLFDQLMGSSAVSAQQGGTAAYLHTLALADPGPNQSARGMTLQAGVPLRDGTVKAKEIVGARATSATFSVGIGELLTCQMEFDGYKYDTTQALASPSYVTSVPFHFGHAVLKLGTYASEAAVTGIRAFSCTINRPHDTEDFTFNSSGYKSAPVLNGMTEISGTIEADYGVVADFETPFTGKTHPSLVFECVHETVIASSYYPTFRITLPGIHISGPGQNVAGYDVPTNQWNYNWVYDGTNLPKIEVISTETSV